jgi:hypothetical protein
LAVTGGTDTYQNVRGQAMLVEFGDGTGSITLNPIPQQPSPRLACSRRWWPAADKPPAPGGHEAADS